jgi:TonB-linked SusC/RagA family outer membrane protein
MKNRKTVPYRAIGLLLCFLLSCSHSLLAQGDATAKGKVFDSSGEELPGVTVGIEGTKRGTSTREDGSFVLNNVQVGAKLKFTLIGMKEKTVVFSNRGVMSVVLEEGAEMLEEVTVVAFGTQRKESVISAIETIDVKELRIPSSNLTQAFSGRIAGMISYQTSGEPGHDNAEFFIRGVTTFGTGFYPLILIDNIEVSSSDLAKMHPDDIGAFSVLKDATATALYGARGANGVVLVTTKIGQEGGKPRISARVETSSSSNTAQLQLADPITYMTLANEAVSTRDPMMSIPYPKARIIDTQNNLNPYVYPNTDWLDMMSKKYTFNERANVNVSGGGKVARFYVGGSFAQDNGLFNVDKRNNFNNNLRYIQYLLHSNVNINLSRTTELIVRLHGAYSDYQGPLTGGSGLWQQILKVSPVRFPAYYPPTGMYAAANHILFGNLDGTGSYMNPYAEMLKGYKQENTSMMMAQLELHQNFNQWIPGLTGRLLANTKRNGAFGMSRAYTPYYYAVDEYDRPNNIFTLKELNFEGAGKGTEYLDYTPGTNSLDALLYGEASLNYSQKFNDMHSVGAMLVGTLRDFLSANSGTLVSSLPQRNMGLSGRFTYGFQDRYFVEMNFGYNGSEKFAEDHRFGFFPSYGAGWIVSNEQFWEPLAKTFSLLKVRYTYGSVGNDNIGSQRFFYMWDVNPNGGGGFVAGYDFNGWGSGMRGYSINAYQNPDITWEVAYKQNLGIELGFMKDKLKITTDIFAERRENILQPRADIPYTMGLWAAQYVNVGKAKGSGLDMAIDYNHSITRYWWATGRFNFTFARSEYVYYEEPDYVKAGTPWISMKGRLIGQQLGYVAERLFIDESEAFMSRNPAVARRTLPDQLSLGAQYTGGDIKYKDINGDNTINSLDMVPMGYPTVPQINYGFGISTGYKNIDFSVFFQGSARSSFFISPGAMSPFVRGSNSGKATENALAQFIVDNRWTEQEQNPYAFWPRLAPTVISNNTVPSTWWLRDNSYLRFKTLEFGYQVPDKVVQKLRLSSLRIYGSASNLFTISNFDLWDVELGGNGLNYPIQKVYNLGINFSF